MRIIDCKQGSPEWLDARLGIVTASELDALITSLWKPRKGEGVQTYLAKKVAEHWRGEPLASYHGGAMEQGTIREDEARAWYELDRDVTIEQVGFILTDDEKMGCSPDGLLPDSGIEIKCPEPHTHVRWLLDGKLPTDHAAQVYGGMFVTGLPRWWFMSYCRGFPPLVLTVESDPEVMKAIGEVVADFNAQFQKALQTVEELNGGPARVVAAVADPMDFF